VADIGVREISKSYGTQLVLDRLSFEVEDKEFLTLLGPSGCGKTTTLMAIGGFEHPDQGTITNGDRVLFSASPRTVVPPEKRNLGVVFQSYAIWPHMTVADNIGFPLRLRKVARAERRRRIAELTELVELSDLADRYPHQLSGGQQQRVALARALSCSPSVLLLDEPFSNLDAQLRERSRRWLRSLQRDLGVTTIFVTHDQDEALGMSDRVFVMDQGVIQQAGTPQEVYLRPKNRRVAEFVGRSNLLEGVVVTSEMGGMVTVQVRDSTLVVRAQGQGWHAGDEVTVSMRPEALMLETLGPCTSRDTCLAEVGAETFLGDHFEYEVRIGGTWCTANSSRAVSGSTVTIRAIDGAGTVLGS
jgi:iron(III) transport system ATP-binding protein